jgi:hypothetical protein
MPDGSRPMFNVVSTNWLDEIYCGDYGGESHRWLRGVIVVFMTHTVPIPAFTADI